MHGHIGRPEVLRAVAPPVEQLHRRGSQECGVGVENRQGGRNEEERGIMQKGAGERRASLHGCRSEEH